MTSDEMKVGTYIHQTVNLILWSMKTNGLEKTLEDLRRTCHDKKPANFDSLYHGLLLALEGMDNVVKAINKHFEDNDGYKS